MPFVKEKRKVSSSVFQLERFLSQSKGVYPPIINPSLLLYKTKVVPWLSHKLWNISKESPSLDFLYNKEALNFFDLFFSFIQFNKLFIYVLLLLIIKLLLKIFKLLLIIIIFPKILIDSKKLFISFSSGLNLIFNSFEFSYFLILSFILFALLIIIYYLKLKIKLLL